MHDEFKTSEDKKREINRKMRMERPMVSHRDRQTSTEGQVKINVTVRWDGNVDGTAKEAWKD